MCIWVEHVSANIIQQHTLIYINTFFHEAKGITYMTKCLYTISNQQRAFAYKIVFIITLQPVHEVSLGKYPEYTNYFFGLTK